MLFLSDFILNPQPSTLNSKRAHSMLSLSDLESASMTFMGIMYAHTYSVCIYVVVRRLAIGRKSERGRRAGQPAGESAKSTTRA